MGDAFKKFPYGLSRTVRHLEALTHFAVSRGDL